MNIESIKEIETKIVGTKIECYEEINSTHIYAKESIKNLQNGTLILAEKQTKGKGTNNRQWYTGKGKNIAFTLVLKPNCCINRIATLTKDVAILMKETIKELYSYELKIKEPNDLMLNNKKIAGILTESSTIGDKLNYIILSMGFNVNEEEFSEDTKAIATSLKKEYNIEFSREEILKTFFKKLDKYILHI